MGKNIINFYRAYVTEPDVHIEYKGCKLKMVRDIIGTNEIANLLKVKDLVFIVGNIGQQLEWIPKDNTYDFWKNTVRSRVVEPDKVYDGFQLEDYPDNCCYLVSEWQKDDKESDNLCFILLTVYH